MPRPKIRNLADIRRQNPLIYEALVDLAHGLTNVSDQTNSHPNKTPDAPPPHSGITVTGSSGYHDVKIDDNAPSNRGAHNFLEWDTNANFSNFKTIPLGPARNWRGALGVNGPVYFRSYPTYPTSAPATPVYYGSQAAPTGVDAGSVSLKVSGVTAGAATVTATGVIAGPTPQASTGTGTEPSVQPQGAAGFGFRQSRPAFEEVRGLNFE